MKRFIPLLFITFSLQLTAQKAQFGTYIPVDVPIKSTMPKMSTNVGFGLSGAYSPLTNTPFYFELKASWGSYSHRTLSQTYMFADNSQTVTDVSYTSAMHKYLFGTKFMLGNSYSGIRGYITPQVGLANMRSKIVIADPQDEDDCKALERETTQRFAGFVYGGEIGAEISLQKIFKKVTSENKHKFIVSANYLGGFTHFKYVNIKHMQNEPHTTEVTHESSDINTKFINVSTNSIHEHKIAELYHTPFQMWGINVGYVLNF